MPAIQAKPAKAVFSGFGGAIYDRGTTRLAIFRLPLFSLVLREQRLISSNSLAGDGPVIALEAHILPITSHFNSWRVAITPPTL